MKNLLNECYEGEHKNIMPVEQFKQAFCSRCSNLSCENSRGSDTRWNRRMSTQEEVLLRNPRFASLMDPSVKGFREMDFKNMLQDALAIEVSTKKGDWSVPTSEEIGLEAAKLIGIAPPMNFKSEEPKPPEAPKVADPVHEVKEERWKVKGDTGKVYEVSLNAEGVWSCTCLSREAPCKHARDIEARLQRMPPKPSVDQHLPLEPEKRPTGASVLPKGLNTSAPQEGVLIGVPQPPRVQSQEDPWAAPKAASAPTGRVVPVGGKISFGGKSK